MCDRAIKSFNTDELTLIEKRLYPGNYSIEGFIGINEKLLDVYEKDKQTLDNAGIDFSQIVDKLELIYYRGDRSKDLHRSGKFKDILYYDSNIWYKVDDNIAVSFDIMQTLGYQECPFYIGRDHDSECFYDAECFVDDGIMFKIMNTQTEEIIRLNKLIIHLIKYHNFFEGIYSPYRLDPAKTISVIEIKQGEKNEVNFMSDRFWLSNMSSNTCSESTLSLIKHYSLDFQEKDSHTIYLVNELFCNFFFASVVKKSYDSYKDVSLEQYIKSNIKWACTQNYEEHLSDIEFFRKNKNLKECIGKTLCLFIDVESETDFGSTEEIDIYGIKFPKCSLWRSYYFYRISEDKYVPLKDEK